MGLFSLERRRLWSALIAVFQYLKGVYEKGGSLFSRSCCDGTRDKGFKVQECQYRVDVDARKIFTVRVVKHWHRFAQRCGDASSLEHFKAGLDRALSNLIQKNINIYIYIYMNLLDCGGLLWGDWEQHLVTAAAAGVCHCYSR